MKLENSEILEMIQKGFQFMYSSESDFLNDYPHYANKTFNSQKFINENLDYLNEMLSDSENLEEFELQVFEYISEQIDRGYLTEYFE